MYSEEIKKLLELKNNIITYKEYIEIVKSPQIDHIKYDKGSFKLWTTDGYTFNLILKKSCK